MTKDETFARDTRFEWNELMKSIVPLASQKEFADALQLIDDFLYVRMDSELFSSVLGMRAQLKADMGDPEAAKADLISAISIARASFARHVNESTLAEIYAQECMYDKALFWWRATLQTCMNSFFPGGGALRKFLALCPQEKMSKSDRTLWEDVARKSWMILNLPGEPDFSDLNSVVTNIVRREANGDLSIK